MHSYDTTSCNSRGKFDLIKRGNFPLKSVDEFVSLIHTVPTQELKIELLKRMKSHICHLVDSGIIPSTVKNYGDIDNFYDANDIGNLCNDQIFDSLIKKFGGRDEHDGMPEGMFNLLNEVKDACDAWMKSPGTES